EDRADAAAAVPVALEAVADGDRRRRGRLVPRREPLDVGRRDAADLGRARGRPLAGAREELFGAEDVRRDEVALEAAAALELRREREREHDVRAGADREVEVGL